MANNQRWYIEHRTAVARRWQRQRLESDLSTADFCELARRTFAESGWPDEDITAMLKVIRKD